MKRETGDTPEEKAAYRLELLLGQAEVLCEQAPKIGSVGVFRHGLKLVGIRARDAREALTAARAGKDWEPE